MPSMMAYGSDGWWQALHMLHGNVVELVDSSFL
jgi:hypothetical protein